MMRKSRPFVFGLAVLLSSLSFSVEVNANEKRIYAPNIVAIVDGVSTKMTTGISDLQENAYMELTDEIKEDSYNMIKSTIECIRKEKNICTNDSKKC